MGSTLKYALRQINKEQWLIGLPKEEQATTEDTTDELTQALTRLFLEETVPEPILLLKLPLAQSKDEIALKLMDALLYENERHDWHSAPCIYRRKAIELLFPGMQDASPAYYREVLTHNEQTTGNYFGDNLSDDSDTEDNQALETKSSKYQQNFAQIETVHKTKKFWESIKRKTPGNAGIKDKLAKIIADISQKKSANIRVDLDEIKKKIDAEMKLLFSSKEKISEIPHAELKPLSDAQHQAMQQINAIIITARTQGFYSPQQTQDIQTILSTTKLYVAQYRGINYLIDRWNAPSRRYHRKMDEVGLPQYCETVLRDLQFCFYTQLNAENDYSVHTDLQETLEKTSTQVKQFLLDVRHTDPVVDYTDRDKQHLYLFNNILERLQHSYSNGIDDFLKELEQLRKAHPAFWGRLPNAFNPFVSTGNTALHALKYAFGLKEYYKKPIRPRYHQNGKIEYSHVGKVYLSLHNIEDWLLSEPNNVPQMDREGRIQMDLRIAPEKETSFLSYMDGTEVIYHFIAKFPDFSQDYRPIDEIKYGLDKQLFDQFKYLISLSKPEILPTEFSTSESKLRSSLLALLGTWLCSYHSVLLTRIAFQQAQSQGGTLLFIGRDGLLTDRLDPETFNNSQDNTPVRMEAHIARESRRQMAQTLSTSPAKRAYHGFSLVDRTTLQATLNQLNTHAVSTELQKKEKNKKEHLKTHITPSRVHQERHRFNVYSSPGPRHNSAPVTTPKREVKKLSYIASPLRLFPPTPEAKAHKKLSDALFFESLIHAFDSQRELFGLIPVKAHYDVGNCLFDAIAVATGKNNTELRAISVTHIAHNQELKDRIASIANADNAENATLRTETGEDIPFNSVEKYLQLMAEDRTWGTEIEVYALTHALQRPIVVITPDNQYDRIFGENEFQNSEPIFLNYIGDNHYEPLIDSHLEPSHSQKILARVKSLAEERIQEKQSLLISKI